MRTRTCGTAIIATLFLIPVGLLQAAPFTFSFDTLASGVAATGGSGPTGSIQNYMNNVLGAAGSVTVSGTNGGALTDIYYNGDGHVVNGTGSTACAGGGTTTGINTSSTACAPTLGYNPSTHTADTFVKSFSTGGTASFTFAFNLPNIVIDSVTFDYEIFPDGTCTVLDGSGSGCGGAGDPNRPDMIFSTNLGQIFHNYGASPTTSPTTADNSWISATETAPQSLVLGYSSGPLGAGTNSFTFTDWPATIAIDNFTLNYHTTITSSVPEPGSWILLGTVAIAVALKLRRKRALVNG